MPLPESIEGKYELLAKLSEGGMGAVYKVRHTLLDEVRVIKVILPHLGHTAELSDRFLREARAASRLRHANIAQILDFTVDPQGNELLVMELIDGSTLKEILRRTGPPSLGLAIEIARQALAALGYLHRRGFVHRDISPDNLMLTRDADGRPLVKLIDLGIAKAIAAADRDDSLTRTGIFLGKPRYASPEQLDENGHADARSDLYSFGIVLYELLTGQCPIAGRTPQELMAAHLMRPPLSFATSDPGGRVPPGLREIVLRMLAKKPQDRLATAEELSDRLADFAAPWAAAELDRILEAGKSDETGAQATILGSAGNAGSGSPPATRRVWEPPDEPSTWVDGVAAAAHATRRTHQPDAPPNPSPPRRSGYTTVPDERSQPIPPPPTTPPVLPPPPPPAALAAQPPVLPAPPPKRRGRGWIAALLGAGAVVAIGLWLVQPSEPHRPTAAPPAVREPSPASTPAATYAPADPTAGDTQTPVEETPSIAEPPAGFVHAQPIDKPAPDYPEQARGTGLTVRATVDLQVDDTGRVLNAKALFLASATAIPQNLYLYFQNAALKAARATRFQPATRDGEAVADKVRLIYEMREGS
jgi:serine/threonine-protein kinase